MSFKYHGNLNVYEIRGVIGACKISGCTIIKESVANRIIGPALLHRAGHGERTLYAFEIIRNRWNCQVKTLDLRRGER